RQRGEPCLVHPADGERHQRQPEQKEQVGPQHGPIHALGGVKHVVVIVPKDAGVGIAQYIRQEDRHTGLPGRRDLCRAAPSSLAPIMVMMMAMTPSVKAASRPFPIVWSLP